MQQFKLGLVINPVAGVGGSVALKGSDGLAKQALALGAVPQANNRTAQALSVLLPYKAQIQVLTAAFSMGQDCAQQLGFSTEVVYCPSTMSTSTKDTIACVKALIAAKVDIILFAGGDGTARDICAEIEQSTISQKVVVLGIPAGCKIHSAVYAITPKAAGQVIELMLKHQLVSIAEADVMDIDESLFRDGIVKAKRFGEMLVPSELRYMQAVKSGGKESDELVLQDIADFVIDQMEDELFIIGSGSTTAFLMATMQLNNTLLGVDVIHNQCLVEPDVTEQALWQLIRPDTKLVITLIGGQGHIFGRGNQQLSPRIIHAIGLANIMVIATKTKLAALNGRPLIADTGDEQLNQALSGYIPVITGYHDQVLYPVGSA